MEKRKDFLKKRNKHDLPIFNSDEDFIKAFEKRDQDKKDGKQINRSDEKNPDKCPENEIETGNEPAENFEALLEEFILLIKKWEMLIILTSTQNHVLK